jgi:hypothetical protein
VTSPDTTTPIVVPLRSRVELTLVNVLVALMFAPLVGAIVNVWSSVGATMAVLAVLAVTFWNVARQWRDRLEVHPDHVVEHRGSRARTIALDDVATVGVTLFDARRGFDVHQTIELTVTPKQGAPVLARGGTRAVEPGLTALAAAMSRRFSRRLEDGETLRFPDRARFPFLAVFGGGALVLICVLALVLALAGAEPIRNPVGIARGALLSVILGWTAFQMLRRWFASRKSRGLAVSLRGVRPLTEVDDGAVEVGGYRDAYGAAAAWIPWGDIASTALDGFGLTLQCGSRAAPIALTARAENLIVLDRLLTEWMQRARNPAVWDAPSGVRVADEAEPEVDGVEAREPVRGATTER